ncbi:MAG: hypothetical protein V7L29_04435 [Nostoc sp.]|uniref:hypothetical protein n=1 Tax=Nostoc sp. TaxID=1180 RepID=UPI002FEF7C67
MPLVKRGLSRLQLVGGRERSNAWMERCKSLVKNFERTLPHATIIAQSMFYQTHA